MAVDGHTAKLQIGIIGAGYVGLTTGVCLADVGHSVMLADADVQKVSRLREGKSPIFEPGLEALLAKNIAAGRIIFAERNPDVVAGCDVIFICVNTPPRPDGHADLRYVEQVAREIAESLKSEYRVVVDKSTVPVHTAEKVAETIRRYAKPGHDVDVVSNPEFLREGTAVHDTLHPDRIVIGADRPRALELMRQVFAPIVSSSSAIVCEVSVRSAELIKHGANSFLATKISFANLIAEVCERAGADALEVLHAIGLDPRIGGQFLQPGIGFGGSCFPKDLAAFKKTLEVFGLDPRLLSVVEDINESALNRFFKKLQRELWVLDGKSIAVLGLSFKPDTDDIRNSPAVKLIERLLAEGAIVSAYDPQAMPRVGHHAGFARVKFATDPYAAATGADAVVVCTEWDEFKTIDLRRLASLMATPVLFDGRNVFTPAQAQAAGFRYFGVGRADGQHT